MIRGQFCWMMPILSGEITEALDGESGEGIYNPFGANRKANLLNNRIKIGKDSEDHPRILFLTINDFSLQSASTIASAIRRDHSADVLGFEGRLKITRRQQMKTPVNARIAGTSPKTTQIA